jgi:hypothetical protein
MPGSCRRPNKASARAETDRLAAGGRALGLPRLDTSALDTTVEIECAVDQGAVAFWLQREGRPICREAIADLRLGSQLLYLSTQEFSPGVEIATRNAAAHGSRRFALKSVTVRSAL